MANTNRSRRGNIAIELAVMSPLMIVMVMIFLNASLTLIAARMNDMACRDAARAAAEWGDATHAGSAAQTAVASYAGVGQYVTRPQIDQVVYDDANGDPLLAPHVTVTTSLSARLPVPILFWGNRLGSDGLVFRKTCTFPIIKLRMPT